MASTNQNLNERPPVQMTNVKTWLKKDNMSPLGRDLMRIAEEIDNSDEPPMDEEAIERELLKRKGGFSNHGE